MHLLKRRNLVVINCIGAVFFAYIAAAVVAEAPIFGLFTIPAISLATGKLLLEVIVWLFLGGLVFAPYVLADEVEGEGRKWAGCLVLMGGILSFILGSFYVSALMIRLWGDLLF